MVSSVLMQTQGITAGLSEKDAAAVSDAYGFISQEYADLKTPHGVPAVDFVSDIALVLTELNTDGATRIAGMLSIAPFVKPQMAKTIEEKFGFDVASLVDSASKLLKLGDLSGVLEEGSKPTANDKNAAEVRKNQAETLRKMLLAMASDMRVVMIRLAVRMANLRAMSREKVFNDDTKKYAQETLEIYAPLANRLGIWQLKWELEDASFRFIEPDIYKNIAKSLEEKRVEREEFIRVTMERLKEELAKAGIKADVSGRPKHIYSIYNKMRGKKLDFSQMYDLRAFRVIVSDIKACFTVLDIIHRVWTPILDEFDDYISRPKPNGYQSLHTVVIAENGQAFEVQIRTEEMHRLAEFGVAAHWRYKESGGSDFQAQQYDEKISFLRQLLSWKTEVDDTVTGEEKGHAGWTEKIKSATLDDRIYVLTPQARIIDLPKGATPIDFAYQVHTTVGHRCRGARVDGVMVPLNTLLKSGQTVEIITAKGADKAGPSRDWLSPGYTASPRTQAKIRAWFNGIEHQETLEKGRSTVEKILQREGKTAVNLEELAKKLGFPKLDEFFVEIGRDKVNLKSVEQALRGEEEKPPPEPTPETIVRKSKSTKGDSGVLVVGTAGVMAQPARCCHPVPPDPICGFVTRGKGVSIHRADCKNFLEMRKANPERVIETGWGSSEGALFPVDIDITANDRQGLLRDISDVFMREKLNVTGVRTHVTKGIAHLVFTVEVSETEAVGRVIKLITAVKGVTGAKRH